MKPRARKQGVARSIYTLLVSIILKIFQRS